MFLLKGFIKEKVEKQELTEEQGVLLLELYKWMIDCGILPKNANEYCKLLLSKYSIVSLSELTIAIYETKKLTLEEMNIKNRIETKKLSQGLQKKYDEFQIKISQVSIN